MRILREIKYALTHKRDCLRLIKHRLTEKSRYIRVKGEVYLSKKEAKELSEDETIKIIKQNSESIAHGMAEELLKRYQNWKNEK